MHTYVVLHTLSPTHTRHTPQAQNAEIIYIFPLSVYCHQFVRQSFAAVIIAVVVLFIIPVCIAEYAACARHVIIVVKSSAIVVAVVCICVCVFVRLLLA